MLVWSSGPLHKAHAKKRLQRVPKLFVGDSGSKNLK